MQQPEGLFVSLIPDGGRRAVGNDERRYQESYEQGAEVVGDILKLMVKDERVEIFAAWGLSDDNAQKRSPLQISILNHVFMAYLRKLRLDLEKPEYETVKVVHMGNRTLLHPDVLAMIDEITEFSRGRSRKIFGLCLGYGSEDEMLRAENISFQRRTQGEQVTMFDCLDLPYRGGIPFRPVDLIVRTGTDPLDGYDSAYLLPYQVRGGTRPKYYPEFLPDFDPQEFMRAIDWYQSRKAEQRLGK